jgi:hypothetical protein
MIYRYLLNIRCDFKFYKVDRTNARSAGLRSWSSPSRGFQIQILQTCKTIRAEAGFEFYSKNKFRFYDSGGAYWIRVDRWLASLGSCVQSIRSLTLELHMDRYHKPGTEERWTNWSMQFAKCLPKSLEALELDASLEHRPHSIVYGYSPIERRWQSLRTGMFVAAAIMTKSQSKIERVVWQAGNGLRRIIAPNIVMRNKLCLRFGPAGATSEIATARYTAIRGEYVDKKDIVLHCAKIRAQTWKQLELLDELDFALSDDALSSESSTESGL